MNMLEKLELAAILLAALSVLGSALYFALRFGRFAGRMEFSVDHMKDAVEKTQKAICRMDEKNEEQHNAIRVEAQADRSKIHERIDSLCIGE